MNNHVLFAGMTRDAVDLASPGTQLVVTTEDGTDEIVVAEFAREEAIVSHGHEVGALMKDRNHAAMATTIDWAMSQEDELQRAWVLVVVTRTGVLIQNQMSFYARLHSDPTWYSMPRSEMPVFTMHTARGLLAVLAGTQEFKVFQYESDKEGDLFAKIGEVDSSETS